ncbi:hypothetical protein [Glutamicibacter sp. ZJUTW]|uniref:hypothetical protein n=2 Tax=Micrococcaceae TaxID=1268 RepID=UPI0011F3307C|nr:hypothetical protein [Glutamicibacter sp. ZJUTW]QEP06350.1 hypothetical protein F0M17_03355 [Glutamicibacter sp. ZJUTW]
MGTANHDETTGPRQTPDPEGENTAVPDPDDAQSAPIPFGHEGADGEEEGENTAVPDPDDAQSAPIPFGHEGADGEEEDEG